ncbi:uncharacterized protein PGTG_09597 [Puccinia graminis f. sp. tritici CRL 75-36-700-3]|uniref:Uncharacterized protein n=1 Tax=Puccinia graminis f. sp. tritici (strain CRL 75-36-700-3 / race SCCL) TaxID=418459 RepID=E3KHV9_PUCGT|nr:uncharacterized protein PGTG_09597 [Puccinia graminis f. sp. tritici CRL 75-36-700-3]EFP83884.1 hypothetical protein PGTG_09597 [Puccinia graminis f. sp. tritici CRL 75-36-700-3]
MCRRRRSMFALIASVMVVCLMVQQVFNRGGALSSIGNGQAKFSFNTHVMKETVDHSKLHHLGEEAHRNQTDSASKTPVPKKPKPAPPFPDPFITTSCPTFKRGHSVVDQLISRKMNIHVKLEKCSPMEGMGSPP